MVAQVIDSKTILFQNSTFNLYASSAPLTLPPGGQNTYSFQNDNWYYELWFFDIVNAKLDLKQEQLKAIADSLKPL